MCEDYYMSESGRKFVNDIDKYCNGKIIAIVSLKSGLKYLMCTTNKLEYMLENLYKDYEEYASGKSDRYSEVYEVMKYGNVKIDLIELVPCGSKYEMEVECSRVLRQNRVDYININLYRRKKSEMVEDILSGVEDRYIARYTDVLENDKFAKYVEEINIMKKKLKIIV
jgi:hypothetical protein